MPLICFFGHHRSASSWTKDILQEIGHAVGWQCQTLHNPSMFDHDLARHCTQSNADLLTFSNAKWEYIAELPPLVGLHVVRDPRDILVSSYFSHRNSHPTGQWSELIPHRAELQAISQKEGLLLELECRREQFEDMGQWQYNAPNIYEVKMETLTQNTIPHLVALFQQWDLIRLNRIQLIERAQCYLNRKALYVERHTRINKLPRWHSAGVWTWLIEEAATTHTFEHKSAGRQKGAVDVHHHYRSGVAGGWRELFFPELTQRFKANYNDLLLQLGYETDPDWI